MVLHLAERLEIPLRERNLLLLAAGYAPVFQERSIGDPELQAARQAMELVLAAHAPNPAIAIDRHWSLVAANRSVAPLLAGVDGQLLKPPVNVLRLSLHPKGLARTSSISPSGAAICWNGCAGRLMSAPMPCWWSCSRSCAPIRRHR